jgi:hypothetical protein
VKRRCAGCTAVIDGRPNKLYCSSKCRWRVTKTAERSSAVSTVIEGTNGVLIAEVKRLGYIVEPVLDVTYGRGGFWTRYRPELFWDHDLHTRDGVSFLDLPEDDESFPTVVFDPPYISTGNRETSSVDDLYDRFGLGELKGWRQIRALIDGGLAECARVLAPRGYLLVKCMDYTESGKKVWNTFHVYDQAEQLGLRMVDRFHHLTGGGPQPLNNLDGTPREQKTAREVTSMLLVFTK